MTAPWAYDPGDIILSTLINPPWGRNEPITQVWSLSLREVKLHTQGYPEGKQHCWDLKAGTSDSKIRGSS